MPDTQNDAPLRDDERWEYGVLHHQGIRTEISLRRAEESLVEMTRRFESNHRNTTKPAIVRRRVSEWAPIDEATR